MSAMDTLVNEVESRFGINSAKAGSLLTALLGLIQDQNGGLGGFLDRFRKAGMSDVVSSWLSGSATAAISPENLQNALGAQTMNTIASRTGLSLSTATAAVGFIVPKLVQTLAPGGVIPTRLPAEALSYLSGATGAVAAGARHAVQAVEGSSLRRWLWPILAIVAALLVFLLWPRGTSNVAFNAEEQVRIAAEKASAALTALKPGYSPQDLSGALNLEIINFQTGSAQIPDYSVVFLNKAAEVIKMAPAGMIVEIAGHTDNTGDAAANLALSQQRADAVRNYLIQQGVPATQLTSKGYGDTQPIASNDTEEGKFRNRRIQFNAHQ
jgi:outer membrane protein OmpA-like peptidoglycan-associated protein/uncharacterized protein YidB (DUF937 family)